MTGAILYRADLTGANLYRADLTGARWSQETQWPTVAPVRRGLSSRALRTLSEQLADRRRERGPHPLAINTYEKEGCAAT
ncbi:pentapeptide repeat-containing protein [Streptomyces sp. NBC_00829]|uniref:pentapeptide repeat-containing protein n=1 Tax=Streptomyces sp. NBC_00829 TaxID=2903679 RepID=UPI0038646B0D